jgi:hypothetical protein
MKTNKSPKNGILNATVDMFAVSDRWIRGKIASVISELEDTWLGGPTNTRAPEGTLFWFVVTDMKES